MARNLKKQESLISTAKRRIFLGIVLMSFGFAAVITPKLFSFSDEIKQLICLMVGFCIIFFGMRKIREGCNFLAGAKGEDKVTEILMDFPKYWYVFNDVYINDAQIDHILICPKGIFTIETKNHKGVIYGNAEKKEWSQVIEDERGRKHKFSFYNPVKQGNKHSMELSNFLKKRKIVEIFVKTIVVFSNPDVTLKVYSKDVPVIRAEELKRILLDRQDVFSYMQCLEVARELQLSLSDSG